jgi:hypothetical protein
MEGSPGSVASGLVPRSRFLVLVCSVAVFLLPSAAGAGLGRWCFRTVVPRFLVKGQWLMDTCHLPSGATWRQRKKNKK